jgi:bacteriocin-like protein
MKEVDIKELETVIGGARTVSRNTASDQQMQLLLSKLSSDIKDLARPQQNQTQTLTMMMAAMIASRR